MRDRLTRAVTLVVLLMVLCVYGGLSPAEGAPVKRLSVATASVGGVYYIWGSAWAKLITDTVQGTEAAAEVTGGPVINIKLVTGMKSDLGLSTDCTSYEAFNGIGWAEGTKYTDIRALFVMYPSMFHLFCIESVPIKSIYDLNGRNLGIGPPGGTVDVVGRNIMDVLGVKPKKIFNLGWSETIGAMRDGIIDAAMDVGGYPHPSRLELQATHKIRHIPLSAQDIAKVRKVYPYYVEGVIPAKTYDTMTADYPTLGTWNETICHKSLSDELAYQIVKKTFENLEILRAAHPSTVKFTLPENIKYCTIPLHPGAIRYFEEMGVKLEPWHYPPEYKK